MFDMSTFARLTLAISTSVLTSLSLHAQTLVEKAERDELRHMAREEPAMRRALERARTTLDNFLKEASVPAEGTSSHALKIAVSDGKNTEYVWVTRFSSNGSTFTGHLGVGSRLVKKYKFDEKIAFDREQIVDWTYIDTKNQRMVGNFTACALLTKDPPAQAEEVKKRYGLSCE